MIHVARALAAQSALTNVTFLHADAQMHPFEPGIDVTISRTGAMFFGDPHAAFENLGRCLKPDGRLVLLTWQPVQMQEWALAFTEALTGRTPPASTPDLPGPFSLSDADHVGRLLEGAGFGRVVVTPLRETMTYG